MWYIQFFSVFITHLYVKSRQSRNCFSPVFVSIICIGNISREEVFEKYCNSILVFPSYIETVGLPLLEAKKCNTPIIASDTAFSHELLDSYDNVNFFDPFDVNDLKNQMKKFILK